MAITAKGFTGSVDQVEFAGMMSAVGGHGVLGGYAGTDFLVSRVAGSRTVLVQGQPSRCWVPGVLVTMDADAQPAAAAANSSGVPRIDTVVMRVDWSAKTATLTIVTGTPNANPQPPTLNANPGVLFDIPFADMTLLSGGTDYATANIRDRRVWLQDGTMVTQDDNLLPSTFPGRLVYLPDSERLILGGPGQERATFQAQSDTGWTNVLPAPAGFTGTLDGRKQNGRTDLDFRWVKSGTGTGTGVEFQVTLPDGWRPGGRDVVKQVWASLNPVRVYIGSSGVMTFYNVTLQPGQSLSGTVDFHSQ